MLDKKGIYNVTDDEWYESTHEAARVIGVCQSSISRCCRLGKYYPKGKILRYNESNEVPVLRVDQQQ